jgi:hypothetical protein
MKNTVQITAPPIRLPDPLARQSAPYYVRAIAMALPAVMLGLQISGWIFFLPGAMQGHADFRQLYTAGNMVRSGHASELFDYAAQKRFQDTLVSPEQIALPFNHLAYEALLFLPYSYLPYKAAYFFFLATNVGLLTVSIRLMRCWTRNLGAIFPWLPAVMFFTFLPIGAAFMQGQDSIILLMLFAASFAFLADGKTFAAGLLIGLGMFKFQIVIPIAILFLLWRRWDFIGGFASSSSAVLLISLCLVGPLQMTVYAHSLLSMSIIETAIDQARFAVHPIQMTNLRGLIYGFLGSFASRFWIQVVTGIASLTSLLWISVRKNQCYPGQQFLISVTAAAVLSYHLFIHDLSILLVPLAAVLDRNLSSKTSAGTLLSSASAIMFAAPAVLGVTSFHPFVISIPLIVLLVVIGRASVPPHEMTHSAECS